MSPAHENGAPHENGAGHSLEPLDDSPGTVLWDRVYVLRRQWWLILLCIAAGFAGAKYKTRSDVPEYQAEATIRRKQERSPLETLPPLPRATDMISEMEIMRSTSVLQPVTDSIDIRRLKAGSSEDAVRELRKTLFIGPVPGSNLIRVSFRDPDPAFAADVVNRTAASYRAFSSRKSKDEARRRREFIATQLAQVTDSVRAAQERLANYQTASGTLNPSDRGGAVAMALMDAETELRNLRFHEGVLQSLITGLRSPGQPDEALRRAVVQGRDLVPGLGEVYARLLDTERTRLTASRSGYTREGPNVEVLDSLIASAKEDIRAMTETTLGAVRDRIQATGTRLSELRSQQGELPRQASEFSRLQNRTDAAQQSFDDLASKYYEAQIGEAVESGEVEIVDAASVPREPLSNTSRRVLILGVVLGTGLGILLAFLLEYMTRKIRTPAEAERVSRLKLLGGIPLMRRTDRRPEPPLLTTAEDSGPVAEAFRMLRTSVHFSKAERPKTVAVTSAGPGEGKSFISANLAVAIAKQGLSVLLIDADMRRSTIHKIFGVDPAPGLSDTLVGEHPFEHAPEDGGISVLRILPCGSTPPNPAELISSPNFKKLLDAARLEFDYIVLDTPPVLAVTDATAIGSCVDGVLMVARAEFTDRSALAHAVRQLRHVRAPLIGIVLNCVPKLAWYGRYGTHYGYYGYSYTKYYHQADGTGSKPRSRISRLLSRT